jgi:hypothetical protein
MFQRLVRCIFVKVCGESNKMVWYPKGEEPLPVEKMTDSHLLNACRMFKPLVTKWATLDKERRRRGLKERHLITVNRDVTMDFVNEEDLFF